MNENRRQFLRALMAGTIGLPWLETFVSRSAQAQEPLPLRFVAMFSPNGTVQANWTPTGTEQSFTLSPILSPLAPHQNDLVIVQGVDQRGAGGDGHQNGIGGMLTGTSLLSGSFAGQGSAPAGWADGPSVDQRIAEVLGVGLRFRSLEFGVLTGSADNWGRMIYRASNRPLPPRNDPRSAFDDIFAAALATPEERERRRVRQTSILDRLSGDLERLSAEVSASDRQQLEQHLTYLREVEQRVQQEGRDLEQCVVPGRPLGFGTEQANMPAIGEAQMDLLALALGCGQTRVASLQWSRSVSDMRFTWLGISEGHHSLSHRPDSDTDAQDKLTQINRWYAERFAGLIERLKRYQEGEGTLFDRCLLQWCNELGTGNTHSRNDAPIVLAGSAGGALRTGRFLQYSGDVPHNNLLVSILNAMGLPDTTFGKPDWCTGPLQALL